MQSVVSEKEFIMTSGSDKTKPPSLVSQPPIASGEPSFFGIAAPVSPSRLKYLALTVIVLLAACLRLFALGSQSFWYDEVCQVLVALSPTIKDVFVGLQQQIAAMPLDFVVVWLFAHLGTQEAILRLPAVIWGVLSIIVAYHLFSRLTDRQTALLPFFCLFYRPFISGIPRKSAIILRWYFFI